MKPEAVLPEGGEFFVFCSTRTLFLDLHCRIPGLQPKSVNPLQGTPKPLQGMGPLGNKNKSVPCQFPEGLAREELTSLGRISRTAWTAEGAFAWKPREAYGWPKPARGAYEPCSAHRRDRPPRRVSARPQGVRRTAW